MVMIDITMPMRKFALPLLANPSIENPMRVQHLLLASMALCYLIPIVTVYLLRSEETPSISNIICSDSTRPVILGSMAAMAICTLLYESNRKDPISFAAILCLLIALAGVILTNESNVLIHYSLAALVFLSMILFLYHHSRRLDSIVLYGMVLAELVFIAHTLYCIQGSIFLSEVLVLGGFALGYLYIHWVEYIKRSSHD